MSDMPERIWSTFSYTDPKYTKSVFGEWVDSPVTGATEYVRADLVDAEIARLREVGGQLYSSLILSSQELSQLDIGWLFEWNKVNSNDTPANG